MKVLFLSTFFPHPLDNGARLRTYHLLKAISNRHEVDLLGFSFGTAAPQEAGEALSFCASVNSIEASPFQVRRGGALARFLSPAPLFTLPIPAMRQVSHKMMLATEYDVIIASIQGVSSYALQECAPTTRILEEHNSLTRMMYERIGRAHTRLGRLRAWASWQKTRRFESRIFSRFDLVTMVSEEDRETSLTALPGYHGPVAVIGNGVDCEHNRPSAVPRSTNSLVFNGSLTYGPNYDAMRHFTTAILPIIKSRVPDVRLTITGSLEGVDDVTLRSQDGIELTGYLDDVRPTVATATVCVAPIREGGGTRLKILEAMALGTPVVATSKAAEGLDVLDGEHLLVADDPRAFGERVIALLRDEGLRSRLAAEARRLVEQKYDWSALGKSYTKLVEETVVSRRSRKDS